MELVRGFQIVDDFTELGFRPFRAGDIVESLAFLGFFIELGLVLAYRKDAVALISASPVEGVENEYQIS